MKKIERGEAWKVSGDEAKRVSTLFLFVSCKIEILVISYVCAVIF